MILLALMAALAAALVVAALIPAGGDVCRCACIRHTHTHLRRGTDCGRCGAELCPRFHRIDWTAFLPPHLYQRRNHR